MHHIKHNWTHYIGLFSSGLCFVHCLILPFLIPLFPALSAAGDHDWRFEAVFIALIALTAITIINGYRLHGSRRTLVLAALGFTFLVTSLFVAHHTWQIVMSSVGSVLMMGAHYLNYKSCRAEAGPCAHAH